MAKRTMTTEPARPKPRKPARTKRRDVIQLRVTADQKARMIAAADRVGLDLSAWLRMLALRAASRDDDR